jgi:hypothetical protein
MKKGKMNFNASQIFEAGTYDVIVDGLNTYINISSLELAEVDEEPEIVDDTKPVKKESPKAKEEVKEESPKAEEKPKAKRGRGKKKEEETTKVETTKVETTETEPEKKEVKEEPEKEESKVEEKAQGEEKTTVLSRFDKKEVTKVTIDKLEVGNKIVWVVAEDILEEDDDFTDLLCEVTEVVDDVVEIAVIESGDVFNIEFDEGAECGEYYVVNVKI